MLHPPFFSSDYDNAEVHFWFIRFMIHYVPYLDFSPLLLYFTSFEYYTIFCFISKCCYDHAQSKEKKSKDKDKDPKTKDQKQKDKKPKDEKHKKGEKKKAERGHPLFGAPLSDIIEDGGLDFIRACVNFISKDEILNSEGIFRVSVGSQRLDALQRRVEECGTEAIESVDACTDPFLVPCLLKKYFREMKEPLFTFDCYTCFISASGVEDSKLRMKKYRDVISMFLPETNKLVLKELFDFLYIVAQHSEKNKVFQPHLLSLRELYTHADKRSF